MYHTDTEIIESQKQNLHLLEQQIAHKKSTIEEIAEFIPGMFHVNSVNDISIKYMNSFGENFFEKESNEIVDLKESFMLEICHPSVFDSLIPQLIRFYNSEDDKKVMGFNQILRKNSSSEYQNFIGFTKISKSLNCFISVENPTSSFTELTHKMNRLLDDNEFLRKNYKKFASLTKREIEIIKLIGLGKSRNKIAESLFISINTFDTHRKNIRTKLNINNVAELFKYIRAFDLL